MRNLYLIRHGRTKLNFEKRYCGFTDVSLCDEGIEQLKAYIKYYQDIDVNNSIFITSGMKRCNETLKIFFGDVPYEVEEGLKEMNFGTYETKHYKELLQTQEYNYWIEDTFNRKTPNGESGQMQYKRVIDTLYKILKKYENVDKDIVIVTHAGTISYIVNELVDTDIPIYELQPLVGCGYVIRKPYNKYIGKLIGPDDPYLEFAVKNEGTY